MKLRFKTATQWSSGTIELQRRAENDAGCIRGTWRAAIYGGRTLSRATSEWRAGPVGDLNFAHFQLSRQLSDHIFNAKTSNDNSATKKKRCRRQNP